MGRTFRVGPIRPPSESASLLLQVTRGCTWNRCRFCSLYRNTTFKAYSADSIKADIDTIAYYKEQVEKYRIPVSGWDIDGLNSHLSSLDEDEAQCFYMVAMWLIGGGENVFLQDGNTTALSGGRLSDVLIYLRSTFPEIKRVTSYGRAENLSRQSPEDFAMLKEAGLDRIHCGFESGSDRILEKIHKGVTSAQQIAAGKNVKAGGIEFSVYFMPGVGGRELSSENGTETAHVINEINPDYIRVRTAAIKPGTDLYDDYIKGDFTLCSDDEKVMEIRNLILHSSAPDTVIVSDHITNLLQNVEGKLMADKERLLSIIDSYLNMDSNEKKMFQAARRMFGISTPFQAACLDSARHDVAKKLVSKYTDDDSWAAKINELICRYI